MKNGHAVARQMHVGFDAGDAGVEGGLERGQRIFRLETAGSAMAQDHRLLHLVFGIVGTEPSIR